MNEKKFFSRVGWAYFIMLALIIGIEVALDLILAAVCPWLLYRYPSLYWVVNFVPEYAIAMPVCVVILRRLPAMQMHRNRFGPGDWFRTLCIALLLLEGGGIVGNLISSLINRITPLDMSSAVSNMMSTGNLGVVFLFSVILAPIMEELVFRKALIDRVIVFGDRTAILLSGLIFGLVHGNIYQFFYAFLLGCLFAYVYIRTGRIRHTISFHMAVNFFGGFVGTVLLEQLSGLGDATDFNAYVGEILAHFGPLLAFGLLEILTFVLAIVGIVMLILAFRRVRLLPGEYSLPAGRKCRTVLGNAGMILLLIAVAFLFITSMI